MKRNRILMEILAVLLLVMGLLVPLEIAVVFILLGYIVAIITVTLYAKNLFEWKDES